MWRMGVNLDLLSEKRCLQEWIDMALHNRAFAISMIELICKSSECNEFEIWEDFIGQSHLSLSSLLLLSRIMKMWWKGVKLDLLSEAPCRHPYRERVTCRNFKLKQICSVEKLVRSKKWKLKLLFHLLVGNFGIWISSQVWYSRHTRRWRRTAAQNGSVVEFLSFLFLPFYMYHTYSFLLRRFKHSITRARARDSFVVPSWLLVLLCFVGPKSM